MKKVLVIALALALVLSMSSLAFATNGGHNKVKITKIKVKANVALQAQRVNQRNSNTQNAVINNDVTAYSGNAIAVGNVYVPIASPITTNQTAVGIGGNASNTSTTKITNVGEATAVSGDVHVCNLPTNTIEQNSLQANVNVQKQAQEIK